MLHKIKAGDEYSIHSPFLFEFYNQTVAYHKHFYQFDELNSLRKELLRDKTVLEIHDLGVGSKKNPSYKRTVSDILKSSGKPEFLANFLFKAVNHIQPRISLELGTSLGLTTLYLAAPISDQTLYTIEGCPQTYDYAVKIFEKEHANNIIPVLGDIDEVLPALIARLDHLDFVFFDANHS
ncbi:MAG TPA: class I SAM-dependent methyltransferase, partial [Cytophagales bacterium]|nr:class I SAM-dependent methyltransferase [Cytophagales bacterium]